MDNGVEYIYEKSLLKIEAIRIRQKVETRI